MEIWIKKIYRSTLELVSCPDVCCAIVLALPHIIIRMLTPHRVVVVYIIFAHNKKKIYMLTFSRCASATTAKIGWTFTYIFHVEKVIYARTEKEFMFSHFPQQHIYNQKHIVWDFLNNSSVCLKLYIFARVWNELTLSTLEARS